MKNRKPILLAFYGDDFTGSTDALEFITRAGASAMLFISPPADEQLQQYPDLDVIGVAGMTRSLPPEEMEKELRPAFEKLKASGAQHVHYKVCSTFDSSPATGSIGRAIDTGHEIFGNKFVPVLGGTPALGRYCVFGNLFARMGTGSDGAVYRLDRHPSMRQHPVTPASESDLCLHLQKQTSRKAALIDIHQQERPIMQWNESIGQHDSFVLIDALNEQQLAKTGSWLAMLATQQAPLFSVGSSAVEMALGSYWNQQQQLLPVQHWDYRGKANPLLVVSGSCSPVTSKQIAWARKNGFEEVVLDAIAIANNEEDRDIAASVLDHLRHGRHVIVHTGQKQAQHLSSQKSGTALGLIARNAAEAGYTKRIIIAGGDTSSYAARAMQIDAVKMIAPLTSGAPLCRAFSYNKAIDGLEVNFKGGQVGGEDYFGKCINGGKAG